MNELASGLEIAIACNWTPVKDALIDTARILHSYDCVGRRRDAIPFLNNSYEILSLMVGDLIVDKVRSGVIQKWKDLYGKTLDELKSAGIALVEDEEEYEAEPIETEDSLSMEETESGYDDAAEDVSYEEEETSAASAVTHREEKAMRDHSIEHRAGGDRDIPFDLPPLSEPEPEDDYEETAAEYEEEPAASGSILAFPGNTLDKPEAESDTAETDAEYDEEADEGEEVLSGTEDEVETEMEEPLVNAPSETARREEEPSLFDVVDGAGEETVSAPPEVTEEVEDDAVPDIAGEETMKDETPEEEKPVTDDIEMVTESAGDTGPAPEETPAAAAQEAGMKETEVQAVLDLDAPADAGTPEHLLRQAQAAMNKGDVSSARSVALELALAMARIEFEQSQAAVATAERNLVDNAQAVKAAQDRVEDAGSHLLQVEELLATRDAECAACRDQIAGMDDELQQFQAEPLPSTPKSRHCSVAAPSRLTAWRTSGLSGKTRSIPRAGCRPKWSRSGRMPTAFARIWNPCGTTKNNKSRINGTLNCPFARQRKRRRVAACRWQPSSKRWLPAHRPPCRNRGRGNCSSGPAPPCKCAFRRKHETYQVDKEV